MQLTPLHAEVGVSVTGIDLSVPPEAGTVATIRALVDAHSFVVFPGQPFDDDRQLAYTRALGPPEPDHVAWGQNRVLNYFGTIGNVQPDGTALGATHRKTVFSTGNNMWHSDASFKQVPADFSIMAAHECPAEGGETLFVSLRTAHARLDPALASRLADQTGIHDYVYSRSQVAPDAVSPTLAETLPPVRQRLVRRNPASGARNLFLGSHLKTIEGWDPAEARTLIDDLTDEATAPEHVLTYHWKPGDFAIWDNRCLIHRGAGYDADRFRRYMRQTRVQGRCNTLDE